MDIEEQQARFHVALHFYLFPVPVFEEFHSVATRDKGSFLRFRGCVCFVSVLSHSACEVSGHRVCFPEERSGERRVRRQQSRETP